MEHLREYLSSQFDSSSCYEHKTQNYNRDFRIPEYYLTPSIGSSFENWLKLVKKTNSADLFFSRQKKETTRKCPKNFKIQIAPVKPQEVDASVIVRETADAALCGRTDTVQVLIFSEHVRDAWYT